MLYHDLTGEIGDPPFLPRAFDGRVSFPIKF